MNIKLKFAVSLVLMLIGTIIIPLSVSAQTEPPNNGNWVINDETDKSDASIILNGDLVVKKRGTLNLYNVDLQFNCKSDREYKLLVEKGGEVNIYDSSIGSSTKHRYEIEIEEDAVLNIYNSNLTNYYTHDPFAFEEEKVWEMLSFAALNILVIAIVVIVIILFFYYYSKHKREEAVTTIDSLVGKDGVVIKSIQPNNFKGSVRVSSRIWSATADNQIPEGEKIKVVDTKGINVIVEKTK